MSAYFGAISLDKLANTLNNAAQKTQQKLSETQEHLTHAIQNIKIDDPKTILSLKTRKRQLQETLGSAKDISQLPPQYGFLERKCDAIEQVCKKILVVSKTFEVEGYDYPPNPTESISDWWNTSTKETRFLKFGKGGTDKQKEDKQKQAAGSSDPPSFAHALHRAAKGSQGIIQELKEQAEEEQEQEVEIDEDVESLIKMFGTWADAQYNMDIAKREMDQFMVKEFNEKLKHLLEVEFKKGHTLRRKVEESRLTFDTLKYEQHERDAALAKKQDEAKQAEGATPSTGVTQSSTADLAFYAQLEDAEDEFVSNTAEAVEFMTSIADATKLISLVKLFQNFQLVYHRKCVQELEVSLNSLTSLEESN
ncbi:AFR309Cp [Eremothecium gossypii ATCC 10895]|uniref:AFR309Cp n=1 Tax=Eremothecium gossypii (strain ATCC 10895 / CBS 109.51 / FGSC 9923 / NRRL Y-1056) TaxID=284811 RepID=Q753K3_EREGS|nr:AFR309Cp [Eremothecium gossypii ATCC 10895]AAS53680.1 AFR309Cp [Eremothecium gossypii ATCC 10895]AEY97993.1 FAFR309Cp [Eremothecium gossypii FDAG1]